MSKLLPEPGDRKMVAGASVLFVLVILLAFGLLTADQFTDALKWLVGAFGLANGVEHIGNGIRRG